MQRRSIAILGVLALTTAGLTATASAEPRDASQARFIEIVPATLTAPPDVPAFLVVQVESIDREPVLAAEVTLTSTGVGIFGSGGTTLNGTTDENGELRFSVRNIDPAGGGTQRITASLSEETTSCEVPTAQPGAGCTSTATVTWTKVKPLAIAPAVTTIKVGQPARGLVTGTQGLTTYLRSRRVDDIGSIQVRTGTIGANGFPYTVYPRVRTFLHATAASSETLEVRVDVQPSLALRGTANGMVGTFTGIVVPGRAGVKVSVYRVIDGVRSGEPVVTAVTDAKGHWTASKLFGIPETKTFVAASTADRLNVAGRSNQIALTFRR